jgi:hypothetical protein
MTFNQHYGIEKREEEPQQPTLCPNCEVTFCDCNQNTLAIKAMLAYNTATPERTEKFHFLLASQVLRSMCKIKL